MFLSALDITESPLVKVYVYWTLFSKRSIFNLYWAICNF